MVAPSVWFVTGFYRFIPMSEEKVASARAETAKYMSQNGISGLVIFATEGVNGTVAGGESQIESFKAFLRDLVDTPDLRFKDSVSEVKPFHRTAIVIRKEIVGLKRPDLLPESPDNGHLSPQEWHEFLASDRPKLVIDTRNDYETKIGKFPGAVDPGLKAFSEWSQYADGTEIPKDVPVLIYCTGGIRCEKVSLELRERGYEQVYQLQGGILDYLKEYPEGLFEGECYVFDDRIAVDSHLRPTEKYGMCPGCGLPGQTVQICHWCEKQFVTCDDCQSKRAPVCSKTCRDRYDRHGARISTEPRLSV
jgi:UPF0176 protein